jgi:hypothetical protein
VLSSFTSLLMFLPPCATGSRSSWLHRPTHLDWADSHHFGSGVFARSRSLVRRVRVLCPSFSRSHVLMLFVDLFEQLRFSVLNSLLGVGGPKSIHRIHPSPD